MEQLQSRVCSVLLLTFLYHPWRVLLLFLIIGSAVRKGEVSSSDSEGVGQTEIDTRNRRETHGVSMVCVSYSVACPGTWSQTWSDMKSFFLLQQMTVHSVKFICYIKFYFQNSAMSKFYSQRLSTSTSIRSSHIQNCHLAETTLAYL